ncbi:MAG: phenylalanine--tRNA ligase subunit beta [Gammaproteobacteria bacterium]
MKLSEKWLRTFADPDVDTATLARALTMAGLMVDAVTPAGPPLTGIVAGCVVDCEPHPAADHLHVCRVDVGKGKPRQIVCGAANARVGLCTPVAVPGVALPGGSVIMAADLRGVNSDGMMCSERELMLGDDHDAVMELPPGTRPGMPVAELLDLDDQVFEFDLTPNRADCFSALGVAREVAAIYALPAPAVAAEPVAATCNDTLDIRIADKDDCPVYCGRIVRGIDALRPSPSWLQERLRRAGIRPLGAAVDVTAYVMLEYGQPLHAFDLAKLSGGVQVRRAQKGESLTLLDGQLVELDDGVLVIADAERVIALAGVMGGLDSAVGEGTQDVFIESAHFAPLAVAGRARRFGLHTDASLRFERGVDPALPEAALERATQLLIDIAGGEAGPVTQTGTLAAPRRETPIRLRRARLETLLGVAIDDATVVDLLERLQLTAKSEADGWAVTVPSYRFDLEIEADLVEELARLFGYDRIPTRDAGARTTMLTAPECVASPERIDQVLVQRGYQQVVTYSFVAAELHRQLGIGSGALRLENPISDELAEMRTSLWPGLIACLQHNAKRQQGRVRIFESGLRFISKENDLKQEKMIAGLLWGDRYSAQWGLPQGAADFYDAKADCEALLAGRAAIFEAAPHPALHPGQSAQIVVDGGRIGWLGTLHPRIVQALDLARPPVLFELAYTVVSARPAPEARPVSRFPALRRDLALVVSEEVTAGRLLAEVDAIRPDWLDRRFIFDIYRGKGVEPGRKSVALGLILQETSRTLTDTEADAFVQRLVEHLGKRTGASLRD